MTTEMNTDDLIFISYARDDKNRVLEFYHFLKQMGFNVWMDCQQLKGGQDWEFEINRTIEKSLVILVFLSRHSVSKIGYVQTELKLALQKASRHPEGDVCIIPVMLDNDAKIPNSIKSMHCISGNEPNATELIANSINYAVAQRGDKLQETQRRENIYWYSMLIREQKDGIPGYEIEIQVIDFKSEIYENLSDITIYIKGQLIDQIFKYRHESLYADPQRFNLTQDKFIRTNIFEAHCDDPIIQGKILSLRYNIYWYGAGAAHPNVNFRTFCFVLDPVILITSLSEIFDSSTNALSIFREKVRNKLLQFASLQQTDRDWIDRGTENWGDFDAFILGRNGVRVAFGNYTIGPYVVGTHEVEIPYGEIAPLMRREYIDILNISYLLT